MELLVRDLPAQHREILVTTYFRHRTIDEAATLLGLTPETAKSRLYQALRDLADRVATGRAEIAEPDGGRLY
jgi:RNA polymerase sigma-70 factor (ECF subfamily)